MIKAILVVFGLFATVLAVAMLVLPGWLAQASEGGGTIESLD